MKYYLSFLIGLVFTVNSVSAQELKFKVKGLPDTTVHLVKYVGSKLYFADTTQLKKGIATFDGSKHESGIMAFLLPGQQYFDFINNNEEVYIETSVPNFLDNLKVKKSKENQVFYNYIHFIKKNQEDNNVLIEKRNALDDNETEAKEKLNNQIRATGERVKEFQKKLIAENEGTFASKVVKMSMDVEIPEPPKNEDGSLVDSSFSYKYVRDHYFDNFDWEDDRILNTPVFQKKLEYYYSKEMLLQQPDTVVKYLSRIIDQIPDKSNMYRFVVSNVASYAEKSNVMGMDKAFNLFISKYYCAPDSEGNPKAYWYDQEKLTELCKDTKIRMNLVQGVRPPNLILTDTTSNNWIDFYSLESDYTILYFWDPNCGHCKKETPKLQTLYEEKLKDRNVAVYAVGKATGDDFEDWKKFIKEKDLTFINVGVTQEVYEKAKADPSAFQGITNSESLNYQQTYDIFSTPKLWILDKDKKIIGKGLGISQLEDYMDRIQGFTDAEKLIKKEEKKDKKSK